MKKTKLVLLAVLILQIDLTQSKAIEQEHLENSLNFIVEKAQNNMELYLKSGETISLKNGHDNYLCLPLNPESTSISFNEITPKTSSVYSCKFTVHKSKSRKNILQGEHFKMGRTKIKIANS